MPVNVELLTKTLETIKANPKHWNQYDWHCGTSHCFAGFTELLINNLPLTISSDELEKNFAENHKGETIWNTHENATEALGINDDDATTLFAGYNSLEDLEAMVNHLIEHGSLDSFEYILPEEDEN